jgi:abhydrolase domain-containing protein 6
MKPARNYFFALVALFVLWVPSLIQQANACDIARSKLKIGSGSLVYQSVGEAQPDKPSIVLLHGLFASKEHWSGMLCPLADAGWHVLAPDLPGYGESQGFDVAVYRLENQISVLSEWLHHLNIRHVHLAGNSMGGTIAGLYGRQFPQAVLSVAMIGAPLGLGAWSVDVRAILDRGDNPFIPMSIAALEEELSLLLTQPPKLPRSVSALQVAEYQTRQEHYQAVWNVVADYLYALCKQVPAFNPPMLLVWGSEDRIFAPVSAVEMARCLPSAHLEILHGQGHLPQLEAAEQTVGIYLNFLRKTVLPF